MISIHLHSQGPEGSVDHRVWRRPRFSTNFLRHLANVNKWQNHVRSINKTTANTEENVGGFLFYNITFNFSYTCSLLLICLIRVEIKYS